MKPETVAIHAPGRRRDGAVAPPLHLSTTFEHGPANELTHGFHYVRTANPNVEDLEARLAALEGGEGAVAYASGMAAAAAALGAIRPGSEIIFHRDLYFDVKTLAESVLPDRNIDPKFIDLRDEAALADALSENTALVWLETPSNPLMDVVDIGSVASTASKVGAKVLVDGTFATPALQRPFEHGADYVLHSLTKYIGGHSDVQGGALIVREGGRAVDDLKRQRTVSGGVLAPFNAWMISRGLQTLHCRMERHAANAAAIADMLEGHEAVARVRYPFLESNPQRALAVKQMSAGGGMASFDLKGGREAALRVASSVKLFVNATSLGGVESLIEHRASVEGPASPTPAGLLRLSVGLEHIDDLKEDLTQALAKA